MFRLVDEFDKKEGYDVWLANSVNLQQTPEPTDDFELAKMKKAVHMVERLFLDTKQRVQARQMREQCAKLPLPCRSSYVKMWHLKTRQN